MSESDIRSAEQWARNVGEGDPHSYADVERAVLAPRSESERCAGLNPPNSASARRFVWFSVVVAMVIVVVPVLGVVQYWSGSFGARYGGNVDVDFDADRASVLVPICFGLLIAYLIWSVFDWLRAGRPRMQRFLFPGIYFGACAGLALVFANNVGVPATFGGSLEATVTWICVGVSVLAVLGYAFFGKDTQRSRDLKVRDTLRVERRDVGKLLVGRGLMTESELQVLISKPFGSFIRDERGEA